MRRASTFLRRVLPLGREEQAFLLQLRDEVSRPSATRPRIALPQPEPAEDAPDSRPTLPPPASESVYRELRATLALEPETVERIARQLDREHRR